MIVCVCRRVSDRDIHRAAREGTVTFDELQTDLGVATACGACLDCAQETWAQACAGTACPTTVATASKRRPIAVHVAATAAAL
jgi:bacterioferritin-associated ferredoxin